MVSCNNLRSAMVFMELNLSENSMLCVGMGILRETLGRGLLGLHYQEFMDTFHCLDEISVEFLFQSIKQILHKC